MEQAFNDTRSIVRQVPRHFTFCEPFWEGTRARKLLIQYCPDSGKYQFYPRPASIFTGKRNLEWREVSGRGELFSWTVAHIVRPPFVGHTPFVVATVTLDEGVNIIADLVNVTLEQLAIGLRVKPAWAPLEDGTNVLLFEPED